MQERCNEVAAIRLQLYVGGRRNAGQIVFIHAAALRGSLGAELKQQGDRCYGDGDGNYTNLDASVQASTSALEGDGGDGTTPTGGSILE